nr:glycolipid transfer protein 1-like [Ipomoea trifida]
MDSGTVFSPALEGMKHVKSENGDLLTKQFLDVCKLILPILDKFGAAMAVVKSDIGGNISKSKLKLQNHHPVAPMAFSGSQGPANPLFWLPYFQFFQNLQLCFSIELFNYIIPALLLMLQSNGFHRGAVSQPSSASGLVAMKLAPDRKKFMEVMGGSGNINGEMEKFCTTFSPILQEIHKFLASVGMDEMKAS